MPWGIRETGKHGSPNIPCASNGPEIEQDHNSLDASTMGFGKQVFGITFANSRQPVDAWATVEASL